MIKAQVNHQFDYQINVVQEEFYVNDKLIKFDNESLADDRSLILFENKVFNVEVLSKNIEEKSLEIKVNGLNYHVKLTDKLDLLLEKLGLNQQTAHKIQQIKAPMPGLVLSVLIEEGMEVKKDDNLLILEAMKMENIIKSPCEGTVAKVLVHQGDTVEKGAVLIKFA